MQLIAINYSTPIGSDRKISITFLKISIELLFLRFIITLVSLEYEKYIK